MTGLRIGTGSNPILQRPRPSSVYVALFQRAELKQMDDQHDDAHKKTEKLSRLLNPCVLHLGDFVKQEVFFIRVDPSCYSANKQETIGEQNCYDCNPYSWDDIPERCQYTCAGNDTIDENPYHRIGIIDLKEGEDNKKGGEDKVSCFHRKSYACRHNAGRGKREPARYRFS